MSEVVTKVGDARQPQPDGEVPFAERVPRVIGPDEVLAAGWRLEPRSWTAWECDCAKPAGHYWHPGALDAEGGFYTPDQVMVGAARPAPVGPEALPLACLGGPLDGWRFTLADWDAGLRAAVRRGDSPRLDYRAQGFVVEDGRAVAVALHYRPGAGDPRRRDAFPLVLHAGPGLRPPLVLVPCPSWSYVVRARVPHAETGETCAAPAAEPDFVPEVLAGPTVVHVPTELPASAKPLHRHARRTLLTAVRFAPDAEPVGCVGMAGTMTREDGTRGKWWAHWQGGKFLHAFWDGTPVNAGTLRARLEGRPDPVRKTRAPRKAATAPRSSARRDTFLS